VAAFIGFKPLGKDNHPVNGINIGKKAVERVLVKKHQKQVIHVATEQVWSTFLLCNRQGLICKLFHACFSHERCCR